MDYSHLLSLINPLLGLLFAFAFLRMWSLQREKTYILCWFIAFTGGSLGFLVYYFRQPGFDDLANALTILLLGIAPLMTARGVMLHRRGRSADLILGSVYVATMMVALATIYVWPMPLVRGIASNWGASLVTAIALGYVWRKATDGIDRAINIMLAFEVGIFLVRPLAILLAEGAEGNDLTIGSLWVTTLQLAAAAIYAGLAALFASRVVKDLVTQLAASAMTDPLTGLPNRAGLDAAFTSQGMQHASPLSLGVADIDHFKRVNDRHGHAVGDKVLQRFAVVLEQELQDCAFVARTGGEEFVILLPGLSPRDAHTRLERLRLACAMTRFDDIAPSLSVTVSIGIAPVDDASLLEEAISRADDLLYQAKAEGRNRVTVALDPAPPRLGPEANVALAS